MLLFSVGFVAVGSPWGGLPVSPTFRIPFELSFREEIGSPLLRDRPDPWVRQPAIGQAVGQRRPRDDGGTSLQSGATTPLVTSAEAGYQWAMLYPGFHVVMIRVGHLQPLAYPVVPNEPEWHNYISQWVQIKKGDGTIQRAYDYWILGKGVAEKEARWSVIKDVLGWME